MMHIYTEWLFVLNIIKPVFYRLAFLWFRNSTFQSPTPTGHVRRLRSKHQLGTFKCNFAGFIQLKMNFSVYLS